MQRFFTIKWSFLSLLFMAISMLIPLIVSAQDFTGYCENQAEAVCGDAGDASVYGAGQICDGLDPQTDYFACSNLVQGCVDVEADDCEAACINDPSSCGATTSAPVVQSAPTSGSGTVGSISAAPVGLVNPLGTSDPREILGRIIQGILGLTGAIALIMFIFGGLMFLTAGGNDAQISKAKKVLIFAMLGIIIIAAAFVATNTLFTAVTTGNPLVGGEAGPAN